MTDQNREPTLKSGGEISSQPTDAGSRNGEIVRSHLLIENERSR